MPEKKTIPTGALALGAMALISMLIVAERDKWPDVPLNQIEGRYHNPCCADIIVTQNYLEYNNEKVRYSVDRLKYGTELTPDKPVGQFYWKNPGGAHEVNTFVLTKRGDAILLDTMSFTGQGYSFEKLPKKR